MFEDLNVKLCIGKPPDRLVAFLFQGFSGGEGRKMSKTGSFAPFHISREKVGWS
jgi:hypothetical protein